MYQRSILSLPFWILSLMLLSSGVMKASPLPSKKDSTTDDTNTAADSQDFSIPSNAPCGPNSKFGYGTGCPQSCDNLYYSRHTMCLALTIEGCICDDGYVLESDSSKKCVPAATCPISCADNMHYDTAASDCVDNCLFQITSYDCDNPFTYAGCVCDDGYILSYLYPYTSSNICVRPAECHG